MHQHLHEIFHTRDIRHCINQKTIQPKLLTLSKYSKKLEAY